MTLLRDVRVFFLTLELLVFSIIARSVLADKRSVISTSGSTLSNFLFEAYSFSNVSSLPLVLSDH